MRLAPPAASAPSPATPHPLPRVTRRSYVNTTACKSSVSFIDGDKGILRYRGYPIEQLAEKSSFLEVGGGACNVWRLPTSLGVGCVRNVRSVSGPPWVGRPFLSTIHPFLSSPPTQGHPVSCLQVAYLIVYGNLPTAQQLQRWEEAVMRHSALPVAVEETIAALPHDA